MTSGDERHEVIDSREGNRCVTAAGDSLTSALFSVDYGEHTENLSLSGKYRIYGSNG